MPQLSITAWTKVATGQKRSAPTDYEYDSEEIEVISAPARSPLVNIAPAQAQNKRQRVLDCVLIPTDKRVQSQPNKTSSIVSHPRARTSSSNVVAEGKQSARRVSQRPAYDESSEDELAAGTKKWTRAKQIKAKPREDSDFEDDVQPLESEDEFVNEDVSDASESAGHLEEASDESDVAPKKKPKPKSTTPRTDSTSIEKKRPAGNGKSKVASTKNMLSLTSREKGSEKGVDLKLPPLHDIEDIFGDMTNRAFSFGLEDALKHFNGAPLRVATMCSGTESPILAMGMIRDCLKRHSNTDLIIDHAFSGEIVPYKQAYIERNFNPPIIFRDITELTEAVNDETPMATTAYGAKVPVPTQIDLLIAGTSCVDFSNLNKHKKTLSDDGESAKTWEAVLSFCKAFKPQIVLLENIKNAEWDRMLAEYEEIGYQTAGVHIDTKNYYLPHTRQRGYMVCFNKDRMQEVGIRDPGVQWQGLMQKFRRPASSPVSSFLLPTNRLSVKEQGHTEDTKREVDWAKCAESHVRYRQDKRLGNARPFTHWQESGSLIVPENGSASWYHGQVERVYDLMDCSLLRKAHQMYDVRFKTRIWDVSQNVYMNEDAAPFGIIGCITPSGHNFASDAGRALTAEENLILQGIPLDKISLTTEASKELQDLAGNAMTSTVVGPAILSALIAGHKLIEGGSGDPCCTALDTPQAIELIRGKTESVDLLSGNERTDISSLLEVAQRTVRRCYCEGSSTVTKKYLQECADCGHTTCISCGGDPQHDYRHNQGLSKGRLSPLQAEAQVRSMLPLRVKFAAIADILSRLREKLRGDKDIQRYADLIEGAADEIFSIRSFRRTHCLTITYLSQSGASHLKLVLTDSCVEWHLFVHPPGELAANDRLRAALHQPVAKCPVSESLFGSAWSWRVPHTKKKSISIKGHGVDVPTWWARNEMPDFRNHKQPQCLTVKLGDDAPAMLRASIEGTYQYLPRCGTACDSLYKRTNDGMFLFLDPTRVGDPNEDCFVFSDDTTRLEYGEIRSPIARIEAAWRPWNHGQDECKVSVTWDADWIEVADYATLQALPTALAIGMSSDHNTTLQELDCSQTLELISCVTQPTSLSDALCEVIAHDDKRFFSQNNWHFEGIRRQLPGDQWHPLELIDDAVHCRSCAPEKPRLRWKLSGDGESIEPYEDSRSAAEYERSIKRRPAAIVIEAQQGSASQVRFGANLISMAHRVRARLPGSTSNLKLSWRLRTDFNQSSNFSFRPFKLKAIQNVPPYEGNLKMSIDLFPNQRISLAWMRQQEFGDGQEFVIEESEEEQLDKLGWALETRAQASIHIRGGICADHPGYGKTILTLALIRAQCLDQSPATILRDLGERQISRAPGLIPTTATLVICPRTLVEQWIEEAEEKLGLKMGTDVFAMRNVGDLDKKTLEQLSHAKLIVVSSSVLGSDQYAERLAAFAGVPGPAAAKGRAFEQWLEYATKEIPEHVRILRQSGRPALRKHVQDKYSDNINSDAFKAAVPSRRLRGKNYVAAQQKSKPSATKTAASSSLDISTVGTPMLEMFYFNRVMFDEYHLCDSRQLAVHKALKKDKVWGLSGTPAVGDFYDIAKTGELIGLPLRIGSDSRGVMKQKNIRELRREMTDFERFDSMRVMPSASILSRIHELDQKFLDTFASRNVTDFKMDFEDHLVPVSLELVHRAVYTEVSQHLNSIEMRLKKGSKSKTTDREQRLYEVVESSETAEEALSKIAAFIDHESFSAGCQSSGVEALVERRHEEMVNCRADLRAAISTAEEGERVIFEQWRQARVHLDVLGDEETMDAIQKSCRNNDKTSKIITGTKPKSGTKEDRSKGLTSAVNTLVNRLLVSTRSLRFVQNLRLVQLSVVNGVDGARCDNPDCQSGSTKGDIALSAFCGHIVCRACYARMKDSVDAQCPASGCCATIKDHLLLWQSKMGDLRNPSSTTYGAKIDAAIELLRGIERKGDQAILFVQYESQLNEVSQALDEADIAATVLDQASTASRKIDEFKSPKTNITAIVLNASNETATGLNLQNANHVIFLSPLLRDQQYSYDATMAQAIGRVRRHGQKKQIHVYRIVALDTIDVDILEHRERRTTAITESGAPKTDAPPVSVQGHVKTEPTAERTQLVRENGKFSLRPQSWLVRCGADSDVEEFAKMQSSQGSDKVAAEQRVKMKGRVLGWEDFSSLIKFSRAYTEDDE